jgi:hypothetical protein
MLIILYISYDQVIKQQDIIRITGFHLCLIFR